MKPRRIARSVVLLVVIGCHGGAAFDSCWVPHLSFGGDDAGSPTRTTAARVAAPRRTDDTNAISDNGAAPETPQSPPQGSYYRIPALPEASPATGGGVTPGGGMVYAAPAPGESVPPPPVPPPTASATAPAEGSSGEAEEETPPVTEAPAAVVVLPPAPVPRAPSPGLVSPGVRPPPGASDQSPDIPPRPEQRLPSTAGNPFPSNPAPRPQNFRVPPQAPLVPR
jgi:hypothetical protein